MSAIGAFMLQVANLTRSDLRQFRAGCLLVPLGAVLGFVMTWLGRQWLVARFWAAYAPSAVIVIGLCVLGYAKLSGNLIWPYVRMEDNPPKGIRLLRLSWTLLCLGFTMLWSVVLYALLALGTA